MYQLMAHQERALKWASSRNSVALFMQMRLGKSLVAIRWARRNPGRKLVIAPLSTLPGWEAELGRDGVPSSQIGLKGQAQGQTKALWYLTNYEAVRIHPEILSEFATVILDESTRIRNPKALVTKRIVSKCDAPFRAILTGLPNPESTLDFFMQMRFLYGSFMGCTNYWSFRHAFFRPVDPNKWNWIPKQGARERIKDELHSKAFFLSREEAGIGSKKVYETRYVEMSAVQKKMVKQIRKEFSWGAGLDTQTKWATVNFVWLARIAGGFNPAQEVISEAKAKEILELLRGELKDEKVVVWCRFTCEILYLQRFFAKNNLCSSRYVGEDSPEERKANSALFHSLNRVMVANPACASMGLDWSCASTAIYYSNVHVAEQRAQSEDRIVHPKKNLPVLYIDLLTKGSLDEETLECLQEKDANSKSFNLRLLEKWKMKQKQGGT